MFEKSFFEISSKKDFNFNKDLFHNGGFASEQVTMVTDSIKSNFHGINCIPFGQSVSEVVQGNSISIFDLSSLTKKIPKKFWN